MLLIRCSLHLADVVVIGDVFGGVDVLSLPPCALQTDHRETAYMSPNSCRTIERSSSGLDNSPNSIPKTSSYGGPASQVTAYLGVLFTFLHTHMTTVLFQGPMFWC